MMVRIRDIFKVEGGNGGLTEEFIYMNQPSNESESIPILSSATIEDNLMGSISKNTILPNGRKMKTFFAPAIIITRNGFAGEMTYLSSGQFTINDHAYVMTLKEAWKDRVNLRWFASQCHELFRNLVTSKSDNATFSKEYAEKQTIAIPHVDIQNNIAKKLIKLDTLKKTIYSYLIELQCVLDSAILNVTPIYNETIKTVFNVIGGNGDLTEEFIYQNQPLNENTKIKIYSGSTIQSNSLGFIDKTAQKRTKRLRIFQAPAIIVVRKGLAGTMKYVKNGCFTTTDDAYTMILKKEWEDKVNLRWFALQYRELFKNLVTSKSDNATFSKEYAKMQNVELPDIEVQNRISEKLHKIDMLVDILEQLKKENLELLKCQIIRG